MSWPNRSVWTSIDPNTAWWYTNVNIIGNQPFANATICQTMGPSVVVHLQQLLQGAMAPGWKIPDGEAQTARPVVNGYLDGGTLAALAAYATLLADTTSMDMVPEIMDAMGQVGQAGAKATPALMRYILWITYYRKGVATADQFYGGARTTKPALLGDLAPDKIFFSVLDLSDEEVSCIKTLRNNAASKCTTLFEELGSSDAGALPLVQGGAIPAATLQVLATYKPACAPYSAWRTSYLKSVGNPAVSPEPLANEEAFMAWRNWILAQAGGARKPPTGTVPSSPAAPSGSSSGSSSWLWLLLLAGGTYAATRD